MAVTDIPSARAQTGAEARLGGYRGVAGHWDEAVTSEGTIRPQWQALFADPLHQYTRGLMASLPRLGLLRGEAASTSRLQDIPGIVPPLTKLPDGCAFAPRCPRADDRCRADYPPYEEKSTGHWAACWHPGVRA